jgi:putative oxidoreductase
MAITVMADVSRAKKPSKETLKNIPDTTHASCLLHMLERITQIYNCKVNFVETYLNPLLLLVIRLIAGYIFFISGILRLPTDFLWIGQTDWSTTLLLFEYEHPVPGLSPELAAYLTTIMEILAPILLFIGFGVRLAAFGLLFMTAVIEFTYQHSMDHIYWAVLLSIIVIQGAGKLSLDAVIKQKMIKKNTYKKP